MMTCSRSLFVALSVALLIGSVRAADIKVDLSKEQVGRTPVTFEPMVGTWLVAQDGPDKVIMVDGRPWAASKDNPTRLLIQSARKLYGTSNEELMDNAKEFAYYPVAVLKGVDNFSNGSISLRFKTIAGDADQCSGILFNVKPNGEWLAVRYNEKDRDIALWEFHNGIRRRVLASDRSKMPVPLDRTKWHELRLTVQGASIKASINGEHTIEYMLGKDPVSARGTPHPDLFPANNPVLRPPVAGRIGLWSKTDSTSYFKDFVVNSQ